MLLALSLAFAAPIDLSSPDAREAAIRLLESKELPCTTPVVTTIGNAWDAFTPEQQARIDRVLDHPGGSLGRPALVPRAPAPPATDSCWSWSDNRVVGEHFVVEYDDGVKTSLVNTFLADLEYSWSVEVDDLGWNPPDGTDDYLLVAYIQNERSGGAYTYFENCGGEAIPYIVSGNDSWDDPDWGATMAAHEFNHAIQFSYGQANEFWWWEATATWVEDYVYPDTDYWAYYVQGYTENPHIAMSASDQQDADIFWHMYGMSVLAFHLDDHFGGHDTVMGTWDDAMNDRGMYSRSPEDMATERGLDWEEVYATFAASNTVMDYEQHRAFPAVSTVDEVGALPASGESSRNSRPQGYGQNYIAVEGGLGEGDLVVDFAGDDGVDWLVQLVEVDRTAVLRTAQGNTTDGAAQVRLTGYGADDVYLVVSPLTSSDKDRDYTWTMSLEAGTDTGSDTGTDTGSDTDSGSDTDTAGTDSGDGYVDEGGPIEISGGCGCDTGGSTAAGLAGLVGLALAARRRR